jgi:hypothetical protein
VKALLLTYHQAEMLRDLDTQAMIGDPRIKPEIEAEAEYMKCLAGIYTLLKKNIGDPGKIIKVPYMYFESLSREDKEECTLLSDAIVGGKVDWSKVSIHESGDSAEVVIGEYTLSVKKIGGKWFGPMWPGLYEDDVIANRVDLWRQEAAALKFYKREIEAGLNDGSITKGNFSKKMAELDWLWKFQEARQEGGLEADSTLFDLLRDTPDLRAAGDSPKVIAAVADALSKMAAPDEDHKDHAAICAACQFLGRHPDTRSIPVLLRMLDQTYVSPYYIDPANNSVRYEATWLDADEALRKITKASPVAQPSRQVAPTEPNRLKVRQAWIKWWDANRPASAPASR